MQYCDKQIEYKGVKEKYSHVYDGLNVKNRQHLTKNTETIS